MSIDVRTRLAALAALCLLVIACARVPEAPEARAPSVPDGFPAAFYAEATARGAPVFRVEPERSLVVIRVYRAGALARFGHDHVVASRDVHGYALLTEAEGGARADLYAPLDALTVDEPALRAAAGFGTELSAQDVDATRRNMLDKVLEAGRYPFVTLRLARAAGAPAERLDAAITLHGRTQTLPVSVALDGPGTEALRARGQFSLRQTDFGITPFSVLGGALQVQDRVDVEFDLYAVRVRGEF